MINLTNRTGYSIRMAAGKIEQVLERQEPGSPVGICDKDSTWGHVKFEKACKKSGHKPIFGAELSVALDMDLREKQPVVRAKFIAANQQGLQEIYDAVGLATEKFYYIPRIDYGYLGEMINSKNVHTFLSNPDWERIKPLIKGKKKRNLYFELSAATSDYHYARAKLANLPFVATQDNLYPNAWDKIVWEMIVGKKALETRIAAGHILTQGEWEGCCQRFGSKDLLAGLATSLSIGESSQFSLPRAHIAVPAKPESLEVMCRKAAKSRGVDLSDPVYETRLMYEIGLIDEKDFEDYFYVVGDMVRYAKTVMLVGPARGSSCGSLVCYLLDITDIDPIPYGLLFERFIDINRTDYPDIDIDFAEDRRFMVFDYLAQKYGHDNVAKLGTVSMFKPKSAITDVARDLDIPLWEVKELKDSIIERSGGDSRAALCMTDTFAESDIGKKVLAKYPELAICADMEAHPRHTGVHAAGIVICDKPVTNYCSIDERSGAAMIDKYDSEYLDLLKIDALGLRTLTVLQGCLDQLGKDRLWLLNFPRNDQKSFDVLNEQKFSGIFQFEGSALKSLVSQMHISDLEDIIAITALARPGPLASGGTAEFVKCKTGKAAVKRVHPILDDITKTTFGIVVYQEQVMQVCRGLGKFSWADTSTIRKTMSKTMGKEYFDRFYDKFKTGAMENGLSEELAKQTWDTINTMGSWAFNRSHAVAYGLVSYWCCVLKAHHPMEFALASLQSAKDDDQSVQILRELVHEGYEYKNYDRDVSEVNWISHNGVLVGPLTGIKGIGKISAEQIVSKRNGRSKKPLTATQEKLLSSGITPWDSVFACADSWGHLRTDGLTYGIASKIMDINDISEGYVGSALVIGKLKKKKTRDANELILVEKRGGKKVTGQTTSMSLIVEDDTGEIMISIGRHNFLKLGKPLIDDGKIGDWYLFKGVVKRGFRMIMLERIRKLTDNPVFEIISDSSE